MYNQDHSLEVANVEGLAVAATKHLELLKQKDEAESSFGQPYKARPRVGIVIALTK